MSKTLFVRSGDRWKPSSDAALDIHDKLPARVFAVDADISGPFLKDANPLSLPSRIYGSAGTTADRIYSTFSDRTTPTGVLLSGDKGSGKTLLAKILATKALAEGMPVILIDSNFGGMLSSILARIIQPAVFFFDEFEKNFNMRAGEQIDLLTVLDGVYTTKKLFLLTCNDKWAIDSHFHNRPGRLFYSLSFSGLTEEEITDYCNHNLKDKTELPHIIRVSSFFRSFNFDMLQALVEEMNRYGEPATKALKLLNIQIERNGYNRWDASVTFKGKKVKDGTFTPSFIELHPLLVEKFSFLLSTPDGKPKSVKFTNANLDNTAPQENGIVFKKDDYVISFTKDALPKEHDFAGFM